MRTIRSVLAAALVLFGVGSARPAWAVPENEGPTLLLSIHVNNAGLAFITVTNPGPSANCAFTLIGFDSTTASGRVMYATALEAFTTGARVVVSYERSGAGCSVTQLSLTK